MSLRVLIANIELWPPSGTVLYTRDLALELQRQGHTPVVFSSTAGGVAAELRDAGIEVTDRLSRIRETPDIIHGHQHAPTLVALHRWPTVPAIHVCHDHTSPNDRTPIHPNIRRHFGVSRVCVQRLVDDPYQSPRRMQCERRGTRHDWEPEGGPSIRQTSASIRVLVRTRRKRSLS